MKKLIRHRLNLRVLAIAGLCALTSVAARAQQIDKEAEQQQCLRVELKAGSTEDFILSEKPVLTFSATECKFSSPEYEVTHHLGDINKAYFTFTSSSLNDVSADNLRIDLSQPGLINISGMPAEALVYVYDINGQLMVQAKADNAGFASVDISALNTGSVYIVSISNTKTFKIIKK